MSINEHLLPRIELYSTSIYEWYIMLIKFPTQVVFFFGCFFLLPGFAHYWNSSLGMESVYGFSVAIDRWLDITVEPRWGLNPYTWTQLWDEMTWN